MSFKVGDKVRLKDGGYLPRGGTAYYSNREFAQIHGLKEGVVYEIVDYNELNNVIVLKENHLCFSANRFELVAEHKIERTLTNEEKQQSKDEFIKYIIEQATNSRCMKDIC